MRIEPRPSRAPLVGDRVRLTTSRRSEMARSFYSQATTGDYDATVRKITDCGTVAWVERDDGRWEGVDVVMLNGCTPEDIGATMGIDRARYL